MLLPQQHLPFCRFRVHRQRKWFSQFVAGTHFGAGEEFGGFVGLTNWRWLKALSAAISCKRVVFHSLPSIGKRKKYNCIMFRRLIPSWIIQSG